MYVRNGFYSLSELRSDRGRSRYCVLLRWKSGSFKVFSPMTEMHLQWRP